MGFESLPFEVIQELLDDKRFTIRKAVPWKGNCELMPEGTRIGLEKCKAISRACSRVRGIAIDPETGFTQTRKSVLQKKLAHSITKAELTPSLADDKLEIWEGKEAKTGVRPKKSS